MHATPGVVLSVASAVVSAAVATYALDRDAPGSRGVAAFSAATAIWAGGNAVQIAARTLDGKLLAVDVQYVGILAVPVAWFVFAAEYTGRDRWVTRRSIGALGVFPVVLFAAVLTNDVHSLVRTGATLEVSGHTAHLVREFGPLFWVATAYSWLVSSLGTMFLVDHAFRVGRKYRRQTVAVLAGAAVPWTAQLAYLAGAVTIEPEAFFGVTAAAFGYAIFRHDFLDVVPVARDQVFEELADGVLVVDGDGRVVDVNGAAERLLGTDVEPGARVADVLPATVRTQLDSDNPDPVRVDNGTQPTYLEVSTSSVSGPGIGELVVLRDVTELQEHRGELDRENDRLERVADTISHDLRNPLNVADGYLELAEESGDPEDFARVREAHERMDGIIEGTLRMAQTDLHAPRKTDATLADVAERAWLNVVTNGAELHLDCEGATVRADPDQLESLLENVFRNSVEHGSTANESPEGDKMRVAVTVGLLPDGEGFYVADDGPGIPESRRTEVFERGYTTSDDGTGLGLAIVRDVADAHEWTVELIEGDDGGLRLDVTGVTTATEQRAAP
jgi:signal transduction histidine kinase